MKSLVALVLLICFLHHTLSAGPVATSIPKDGCCPIYVQYRIPRSKVIHVAMTRGHCGPSAKAVVVTTVKQKICLDPHWKWAKILLAEFQNSSSAISKP